jgi:hypothetical protein
VNKSVDVLILFLLILAAVLFLLAVWNFGAPKWNLIAAGLCATTVAAIVEFMNVKSLQ